jgi:large subunit ribosomal protein L4
MPTVDVIDWNNNKVGELELSDEVFGAETNNALLYETVRHSQAGQRSGTAKTKTRHEVSGSGKKLWRQKGTGRARVGSIRSPIWRHGGTVHGPVPRSYAYKLPRKMMLGGLRSALSAKLRDGELRVVQSFTFPDHRTRTVHSALRKLEAGESILLVDNSGERNVELGARNLPGVTLLPSHSVTAYALLRHKHVLLSESAAKKLSEALAK